jgi:hypothetical protein
MPAHFGAYKEYWLKPFEYPLFNIVSAFLFFGGIVVASLRPVRSQDADS